MHITNDEAVLTKLGYSVTKATLQQLKNIKENTTEYEKIIKHILDLHDTLQVNKSYVAMSNSVNYFKIKIDTDIEEMKKEALEKIEHFKDKFKATLEKVDGKDTFYIKGFHH